jgi:ATP-dependent Lon protease
MVETAEKIEKVAEAAEAKEQSPHPPTGEPFEVAVLPLQNTTLFPETVVPLAVGRPRSVAAVEAASPRRKTARLHHRSARRRESGRETCGTLRGGHPVMVKRMERMEESMHIIAHGHRTCPRAGMDRRAVSARSSEFCPKWPRSTRKKLKPPSATSSKHPGSAGPLPSRRRSARS